MTVKYGTETIEREVESHRVCDFCDCRMEELTFLVGYHYDTQYEEQSCFEEFDLCGPSCLKKFLLKEPDYDLDYAEIELSKKLIPDFIKALV